MTHWPALASLRLETQRLQLRPITIDDIPLIYFLRSDKLVNQYLKRDLMIDRGMAKILVKDFLRLYQEQKLLYWVLDHPADQQSIGTICLWNFTADRLQAEVGYEMDPAYHGQGLMGEALYCVLDYGKEGLDLNKIVAYTQGNNASSIRMLERSGFCFEPDIHDQNNQLNKVFSIDL